MDMVEMTLKDIEDATVLFERKLSSATILHFRITQCAESLRRIEPSVSESITELANELSAVPCTGERAREEGAPTAL